MKFTHFLTISSGLVLSAYADGSLPQKDDYVCKTAEDCPETTITLKPKQVLKCFGEESCKNKIITVEKPDAKAPNFIECYGEDSCYGTTVQVTKQSEIYCLGSQACKNMKVASDVNAIYAWGEEGFMGGALEEGVQVNVYSVFGEDGFDDVVSRLAASSVFDAYQSARDTMLYSDGQDVELEFSGYDSTANMELYCEKGSTCFVNCIDCRSDAHTKIYVTEDSKLKLNCPFKDFSCAGLEIMQSSEGQAEITGAGADDVQLALANVNRRLQPKRSPIAIQSKQRKLGSTLCRDFKECKEQVFGDVNGDVYCDGTLSCMKASTDEATSTVDDFFVTGFKGAVDSVLSGDKFEVEGMLGLLNADIRANSVDVEGYRGAMRATIRPKTNTLHVDSHAVNGLIGASIICEEGATCELECNAFQSCKGATLDCRATDETCTQTCDEEFSGCATEIPDCTEITLGKGACNANKFCFWAGEGCKNKEQASCDQLTAKQCAQSNGVCSLKKGKCIFNEAHRPIPKPEFPIRI